MHGTEAPSPWVRRWSHLVPPGAAVLDVACGLGRHLRWFRELGHPVAGIDRDPDAVAAAQGLGEALQADLEGGPWPLPGRRFGGVVVANYLWRPLFPALRESLDRGGVLIYETVGRPARPEFLLQPGELLALCQDLRVVAFEDGFLEQPPRFVQRIAAVRAADDEPPARYLLK